MSRKPMQLTGVVATTAALLMVLASSAAAQPQPVSPFQQAQARTSLPQEAARLTDVPVDVEYLATSEGGEVLEVRFDRAFLSKVRGERRVRLVGLPLPLGGETTVELERTWLTTADLRIVEGTDSGDVPVQVEPVSLFRGRTPGGLLSFLTFTSTGCQGIVAADGITYVIEPVRQNGLPTKEATHLVREASMEFLTDELQCGVDTSDLSPVPIEAGPSKTAIFRFCRMALECDYEYWQQFLSMDDALAHLYTVWGIISSFYESDLSVKLTLPFIRIWTTSADPYSFVGGERTGLDEFENYWRANHNSGSGYVDRDLAHLMSGRGVGAWGEMGVLCDDYSGFSISGGNGVTVEHDVFYDGHEVGHNFNGIHTFDFNPPLDNCTIGGYSTYQDCSTAPGTIMSYCHHCGGFGPNFILHQFATENIARIRPEIDGSCLQSVLDPVYVDRANTGTETGEAAFPYDTVVEGTHRVAPDGTIMIQGGSYPEAITIWQPMTLRASGGTAAIGQ